MKRMIVSDNELEDMIRIYRITVTVEFETIKEVAASQIAPLQNEDGSYNLPALDEYEEFIINALGVFSEHDFEVIEEHESPYSKSNYFSLVKKEDLENHDYKYILFIRISDHEVREVSKKGRAKFNDNEAERLKTPQDKAKQKWKMKDIIVNGQRFETYDEALDDIDRRLSNT